MNRVRAAYRVFRDRYPVASWAAEIMVVIGLIVAALITAFRYPHWAPLLGAFLIVAALLHRLTRGGGS